MKTFPLLLIFLWYIACCGTKTIQAQNTFEINIGSEEQEYVFNFVLDDDNNYVGIVIKTYPAWNITWRMNSDRDIAAELQTPLRGGVSNSVTLFKTHFQL